MVSVSFLGSSLTGCLGEIAESSELDKQTLEKEIHGRVNQERSEQGLQEIDFDDDLAEIARGHSKDMVSNGFFSHRSPTNGTLEERYESAGYNCQVGMSGSQYSTGGENIAKTWYEKSIDTGEGTTFLGDIEEVADFVIQQWMNSPGHRENLLQSYWQNEGIGVATAEEGGTAVYVTQNFC